jgi:hypothetical protein
MSQDKKPKTKTPYSKQKAEQQLGFRTPSPFRANSFTKGKPQQNMIPRGKIFKTQHKG